MSKMFNLKNLLILINLLFFIFCGNNIIDIKLNELKKGTLKNNEYEYYRLTLPEDINKNSQIVFELEPNPNLDSINNIVSDPNLYISVDEQQPTDIKHTWSSKRFGDETISISGAYINPFQNFYIGIHCKEKCNYLLEITNVTSITLKENKINSFTLEKNAIMKFSFSTRKTFKELSVNLVGSFLNSFNAYLSLDADASSSNTLEAQPILYNGYKFSIKSSNLVNKNGENKFNLVVDSSSEKQDLNIWLQYDDDVIRIKEAELFYDSVSKNKANCYYYTINKINQNKDIILSTTLFNGLGFIHIAGFNSIDASKINEKYKTKSNSYAIIQNKAIRLTKDNFKNYGTFNEGKDTYLYFCFYAEKDSSYTIKMSLLENFKNIQTLNYIYPGIKIEDILPKKSITRYKMENFNIENDLNIFLTKRTGNTKLYLYMVNPDKENELLDYTNFQSIKNSDLVLEGQDSYNGYYLFLTKELNKCKKSTYSKKYTCYLNAVVECDPQEDCTYDLFFDHSKLNILMEEKQTYTNVISENEFDRYSIDINNPSIKNIAIVLTQNTGKTILKLDSFVNDEGTFEPNLEINKNDFMPGVIKISHKTFNLENLVGHLYLKVEGLSYASYSIYYYTFNEDENEEYLDQDKVTMKLETGKIIKDIFMDNHKFKVYMYDSSNNGAKTNLYISLIETDSTNSELYVFKDLNDFSFVDDRIYGYLWKGEYSDYIYINKDDKNYKENDILYIMIYKKSKYSGVYTTFYLGITDENTPFLLNEGIEFRYRFDSTHKSQKFFYYYINDDEDLQISLSLYFGRIIIKVKIDETLYTTEYISDDSHLINIRKFKLETICKNKLKCPINIEVSNNDDYSYYSSFLIAVQSSKNVPIYLKQGVIIKKSILSGEDQHFIIDVKPDKSFGAKISAYFEKGQGELYARKVLKSELYNITNYPDENNYEYVSNYRTRNNGFYLIEIPYEELASYDPCKILLTVRGLFPGYYSGTKIEYSLSISNTLTELETDKNYRLFICLGEIIHYHFKVGPNKKRLYISMTNKEKDANMYLNYDTYLSSISEYQWKNVGGYNEYLDLSLDDSFFAEKQMTDIDGDYYLAIQGLSDSFYNLYISTEDVKIMTLSKGVPAGCSCEKKDDFCYFVYENINNPFYQELKEQNIIFYTDYTYGSGSIYGKLYKNGNMEEIINSLPSSANHDYTGNDLDEFLFVNLNKKDSKYTLSSVVVLGVQCKGKALFDFNAAILDRTADLTRNEQNFIFLRIDQDNIFYISKSTGKTNKFVYYIYTEEDFNFKIKGLVGQAEVHTYTNDTLVNTKYINEIEEKSKSNNYHHISDFVIDSDKEENKAYYGTVPKEYSKRNYFFVDVKPFDDCLININIHYDVDMEFIPINKEVIGIINRYNYYAYFDLLKETEEVIITVTSLEKDKNFQVFLKKNIIKLGENDDIKEQQKYSKPNVQNYDIKGETNPLTSAISLRIKNVEKDIRNESKVRVLLNVESERYSYKEKIKIIVTPVLNNINRIRPQPHVYYFSDFEKKYSDKTLYILKNKNKEDDLMVIEISLCKGNFIYALVDSPPTDTETYTQLQLRRVKSNISTANGKKIITIENIEVKEYYLMVYGANSRIIDIDLDKKETKDKEKKSEVDLLFIYYTTNKKKYNYLVTQDYLNYEGKNDYYSVKIQLPELKKRDILGRENYIDYMNYTFIVSEKKEDFEYMESTCYLTKLMVKEQKEKKYKYLKTIYDKDNNVFVVKGFKAGRTYYINLLAKNEYTGEVITYNPFMIVTSLTARVLKSFYIFVLLIILCIFIYLAFKVYRKFRIERAQLEIIEANKNGEFDKHKIGNLKNINLDIVKKKYNTLKEEKKSINDD